MENKKIIDIKSLNLKYNNEKNNIFDNIDFYVYDNELLSIIGESGSGKTTLVKYILGLNKDITTEKVKSYIINNIRVDLEPNIIQTLYGNIISMVLQDPVGALNPTLKIGKQFRIMLKQRYGKISNLELDKKLVEIFEEIKIDNYKEVLKKYPSEISGGMNQRINIALSLIKEPKILVLDEPTSAIDEENRKNLIMLIRKIQQKRKITIIFITHDILLAKEISDRMIVMRKGKIVEEIINLKKDIKFVNEYTTNLYESAKLLSNKKDLNTKEVFIKVENLTKSFNNNIVVNDVSFEVLQGDVLGIVGASGSGKSTICKLIMGIYTPTFGTIEKKTELKCEMVYQNSLMSTNPRQSIYKILNEENYIKKRKEYTKEEIQRYLRDFNLPDDILNRKSTDISGGQRQLVSIIRSLLNKPDILILDEPTSSLDVISQKKLLDLLINIKEKYSLTYIIISHDKKVINYMCNRIITI